MGYTHLVTVMSSRELTQFTDFTALMATRKYGKVPSGHPIGSLFRSLNPTAPQFSTPRSAKLT